MRAWPGWASGSSSISSSASWPSSVRAVRPATTPTRFLVNDCQQLLDRLAACLAEGLGENLAFDLAAEQRADARAGETEPQLIDEIRRQHERVAERETDFARIDLAALGRRTRAPALVPVFEHGPRGLMFHCRHLLCRRETCAGLACPRSGQGLPAFVATPQVEQGACRSRAGRAARSRISLKTTIALAGRGAFAYGRGDPHRRL